MCHIEDLPDLTAPMPAGERFGVLTTLRDVFGNVCTSGGIELRATVRARDEPQQNAQATRTRLASAVAWAMVWDRRDGTYETVQTPTCIGRNTPHQCPTGRTR